MTPIPPIRNARIYWRPNRGPDDAGGFYPVCLEDNCNSLESWGTSEAGHKTGEQAAQWLIEHKKNRHSGQASVGLELAGGTRGITAKVFEGLRERRDIYKPADTEPGAP